MFRFQPLGEADVPMLHDWLNRPHVAEWWDGPVSLDEVRAHYLGHEDFFPYVAALGDRPIGYIQAYQAIAHPDFWPDVTDPGVWGADQFIAEPDLLGRGLGTRMLRDFVAFLFENPAITTIQTDPSPDNARAIASYRKAGFREQGLIQTPDGPALLMTITRPHGGPSALG